MSITVIIPNFNGEEYLEKCLSSLQEQTYRDFDVIVVDNASNDRSLSILSNYKSEKVHVLYNTHNIGFATAVNMGIQASESTYVVLLNNDTEVEEGWLSSLVESIETDPSIFSVSSKMIRYHDRDKIDDAGDGFTILGWAYKLGDGESRDKYNKFEEVFSACAGAAIYRKSIFHEIGLFDESFFAYLEDVDIGYRARIAGYRNCFCPKAIVYHIGSATSGSRYNSFKIKLSARNFVYVVYKNMPFFIMLINFPFLLIGLLIKGLYFTALGYGKDYILGLWEGICSLHRTKKIGFERSKFSNYLRVELLMTQDTLNYFIKKIETYKDSLR